MLGHTTDDLAADSITAETLLRAGVRRTGWGSCLALGIHSLPVRSGGACYSQLNALARKRGNDMSFLRS